MMRAIKICLITLAIVGIVFAKVDIKTEFEPINSNGFSSLGLSLRCHPSVESIYTKYSIGFRSLASSNWVVANIEILTANLAYAYLWHDGDYWTNIEIGAGLVGNDTTTGITLLLSHKIFPAYMLNDNDSLTGWITPSVNIYAFYSKALNNDANKDILEINGDINWALPWAINSDSTDSMKLHLAIFASADFGNKFGQDIKNMTLRNSGQAKIGIGFAPAKYKKNGITFKSSFGYMITPDNPKAVPYVEGKIDLGEIYAIIPHLITR